MPDPDRLTAADFAALLAPLGPFGSAIAVAVSGGADSIALAFLAQQFVLERGIGLRALIVDHGLRPESAAEAALAVTRLAAIGIAAVVLGLEGLRVGPGLAERARAARYARLAEACRSRGIVHLLVGHHARDQAETLMMREAAGSGFAGMAGMATWRATADVCVLRPLLGVAPERLRATLRSAGLSWSEDPSNTDPAAQRTRLRARLDAPATQEWLLQAQHFGALRSEAAGRVAASLAARVSFYPEGYAILAPAPIEPAALAAVLQAVSGAPYPPASRQVARLAAAPAAATLAGVRLLPAGRLAPGRLLVVREAAAQAAPCPARPGVVWDRRFRLAGVASVREGATLGALGAEVRLVRRHTRLPEAILCSMPAIRSEGALVAVPQIGYPASLVRQAWPLIFCPAQPAAGMKWGT